MMKIIKIILFVVVCVVLIIYVIGGDIFIEKKSILIGNSEIIVDIADTVQKRNQGLSGTESLEEGTGMLFVFDEEGKYGIWMKDMNYSIDIIWINKDFRIVNIEEDVKPESYPFVYKSIYNAMYVLEVPSGFSQKMDIKIGDVVKF